jgi:hypothetical protein
MRDLVTFSIEHMEIFQAGLHFFEYVGISEMRRSEAPSRLSITFGASSSAETARARMWRLRAHRSQPHVFSNVREVPHT